MSFELCKSNGSIGVVEELRTSLSLLVISTSSAKLALLVRASTSFMMFTTSTD